MAATARPTMTLLADYGGPCPLWDRRALFVALTGRDESAVGPLADDDTTQEEEIVAEVLRIVDALQTELGNRYVVPYVP